MPKSIYDPAVRASLLARIDRLGASDSARWGQFTAPKMVTHLIESLRMAANEIAVPPRSTFLSNRLVRYLVIYVLPFPRGAPTARQLLARAPDTWASDVSALKTTLERTAAIDPNVAWPAHPAFGDINGSDWGVLIYRHMDHHLRQFGA
ncbi:MAG: DUF1569 domain-containing protein [Gemmatimonadetes bacterium]|nr:DUF1569 domain-containing protein [Gemmatimonadota bacterium]